MEDRQIVELYWARDQQAIEETAAKYGNYCHAIASRILGNAEDAEECVNDTYRGAWDSIPPHRPAVLQTYLAKLTRRISMKVWRSRDTQKRGGGELALSLEELGRCIPDGKSIDEGLCCRELVDTINRFLREQPEQERRVFILRYFHTCSIAEIGKRFGFSKSKVESMLHRTRKKLKKRLEKEGYFHESGNSV